ncbi:Lrp/AsnC family transcriptional regulator [Aerococcus agrisoli]|uniref:Lrp/AsnC family transcriptional regulator n=1 Tax=Aerococcus agrisoli TaxID=2487350 RepID=A0A3N4GFY0_9LACT|nr:Lrp/AsnC family transcriptional regulator [Aerococcus agrisoli]RPA60768.1 Lrp/AsnC family transcriptional regulator [Aerococcus agrisoli]
MDIEQKKEMLRILAQDARLAPKTIANMIDSTEEEVVAQIEAYENENVIAGYHTMINWDVADDNLLSAMVEVNVDLHHGVSYKEVAEAIYEYDQVESLYLMSGAYDFLLLTKRLTMLDISKFISKLASIDEVSATTTHIVMNRYKEQGVVYKDIEEDGGRMVISQ